jgi:hypothetical protein
MRSPHKSAVESISLFACSTQRARETALIKLIELMNGILRVPCPLPTGPVHTGISSCADVDDLNNCIGPNANSSLDGA